MACTRGARHGMYGLAVDLNQEGKRLVEHIICRKRVRMFLEGIAECEACPYPRPGTCLVICSPGCGHYFCPGCAEEARSREAAWLDRPC
jgi:hypothetical protein